MSMLFAHHLFRGDLLALAFVLGWVAMALKRIVCRWWSECLNSAAEDLR